MEQTFGIDTERIFFVEHEKEGAAESALDILISSAESGVFGIIVVNSLKCLIPRTELEGEMGDTQVALQARMNNKLMRKLTPILQEADTTLALISHKTSNIGNKYNPFVISGGRGIRYASLLTLDFTKLSVGKSDPITKEEGMKFKVSVLKNHCSCMSYPYLSYEYYIRFAQGIAWDLELFNAAVDTGLLKVAGAWVSQLDAAGEVALDSNGVQLKWNGKNAFMTYIRENEAYRKEVEAAVLNEIHGVNLDEEIVERLVEEEKEISKAFNSEDEKDDVIARSRKKK